MFINPDLQKKVMLDNIEAVIKYFKKMVQQDENIRDTRFFMSFLMRLPQIDQRLFGLIYYRKQAIQSFPYTIKFPDGFQVSETEKKQLLEMKERWLHTKMHTLLDTVMNGRLLGMAAKKMKWDHSDTYGNFVSQKEDYLLSDLDFDLQDDDKLIHIDTDTKTQKHKRKPLEPETNFTVRFNPMSGFEKDFPGGFVRINWIRVLIKYWDFFNWARDNEKSAIIANYEERYHNMLDEILAQLDNLGEGSSGAVPKGVEVEALHKMNNEMIKSHTELEQSVDRALAFSIAGTTSQYEKGGGSYARDMIGYEVAEDVTFGDLVFAEREITSQYLLQDYKLNYAEPKNAYPVFDFTKSKIKDMESRSRIVTDYISSGIPVIAKNVYDDVNLTRPEGIEENEVVKSEQINIGG